MNRCGVPVLTTPEVEVWYGTATGRGRRSLALPEPTPAERERAGHFVRAAEGVRYLAQRLAARRILADHLRCPPEDVLIGQSSCPVCGSPHHGPPRLFAPQTPLTLSLARSGPHWLLAMAPGGGRTGTDIELLDGHFPGELAKVCLTPAEQLRLHATERRSRGAVLQRCLTRKEAVARALGGGPPAGLSTIETGLGSGSRIVRRAADPSAAMVQIDGWPGGRFLVRDLRLPAGLSGAVAWEPPLGSPLRSDESPSRSRRTTGATTRPGPSSQQRRPAVVS